MGTNKITFWLPIIDRIRATISTWKARWLSLLGHIFLIKVVLTTIPKYYLSILNAPSSIILQNQKINRDFIWKGNLSHKKKLPLFSFLEMSHDKASGGVGLHDIATRNKAFGGKLVLQMYTKSHAKWCSIMQGKYLDSSFPSRIFTVSNPLLGSAIWNLMMSSKDIFCIYVTWEIHSGEKVKFWEDSWNGFPPLCRQEKLDEAYQVLKAEWGSSFWDYVLAIEIHSRRVLWKEPPTHLLIQPSLLSSWDSLAERIIFLSNREDIVIWAPSRGCDYSIKDGYYGLRQTDNSSRECRAFSFCWNSTVLPKAGCFAWLALRKRILTSE